MTGPKIIPARPCDRLTPRKRSICQMVSERLTLHEIAAKHSISYQSIRRHLKEIYDILGCDDVRDLAIYWLTKDTKDKPSDVS